MQHTGVGEELAIDTVGCTVGGPLGIGGAVSPRHSGGRRRTVVGYAVQGGTNVYNYVCVCGCGSSRHWKGALKGRWVRALQGR
jgi:hypothetical protein